MFLKNTSSEHYPYSFTAGRYPNYIFWDRFNYRLKNHFYTCQDIPPIIGKPIKRFALFMESEAIIPECYKVFNRYPGLDKDFDVIFSHSVDLLDKYKNAKLLPCAGVWYGTKDYGGVIDKELYKYKTKNISLISSNKRYCKLHDFRLNLARYYKKNHKERVDTYGTFDGGSYVKIADVLEKYRYSIVIENNITPYFFTEKILNCFASMTIPIYIGATKISDFFNTDGIIQIQHLEYDYIDKIIAHCNEEDYLARLPAMLDNFNRVKEYFCLEDYLYTHYEKYFA
jgi:hypothetical protein